MESQLAEKLDKAWNILKPINAELLDGEYLAEIKKILLIEKNDKIQVKWTFEILDEEYKGELIDKYNTEPSPKKWTLYESKVNMILGGVQ